MKTTCSLKCMINSCMIVAVAAFIFSCGSRDQGHPASTSKPVLNVLAYIGYDESEYLLPLEQELGITIKVKTYINGDEMFSLISNAADGSYDLVVADAEYGAKLRAAKLIDPIADSLWKAEDLLSAFREGDPLRSGNEVYGVVVRWGACALVYNTEKVTAEQAASYRVCLDTNFTGRVGLLDWYLPNMGVMSKSLGNDEPYKLDADQFEKLQYLMKELRPQVNTIHSGPGDLVSALASGDIWISPGIGEWAASALMSMGKAIDWTVPKEGGVMWVEAMTICRGSAKKEICAKLIAKAREDKHLARLAWRKAYQSQTPRWSAYACLSPAQRRILKATTQNEVEDSLRRLAFRRLPEGEFDESRWEGAWRKFKVSQ